MSARATRAGRLSDYLGEMFPPAVVLPAAPVSFLVVWFGTQLLQGSGRLVVGWQAAVAAVCMTGLTLLLRIYDELKDVETDLRLGRAGDPRYKDRAIVTGRVRVEDIQWLRWVVTAIVLASAIVLHRPMELLALAVAFVATYLSFRWFFLPVISRHLLLAFVTHNPLSLVLNGYVMGVYLGVAGLERPPVGWPWLLLGVWLQAAAWETARKVRIPADETSYQTYSLVLGYRVATLLPAGFAALAAACFVAVARHSQLPKWFEIATLAAACVSVLASLRALVRPSTGAANLRPFAEGFVVVTNLALSIAAIAARGVMWSDVP